MADALPKPQPAQLKPRFCQPCTHLKDSAGNYLRHMPCCPACKYSVCRACFVQNARYRKAFAQERAERLARRIKKEAKMNAEGRTYEELAWEELEKWEDDSEWENAELIKRRREGEGGYVTGEGKEERMKSGRERKRTEKDCPEDCYGECCLEGGWVWLQERFCDDSARPDLFGIQRLWFGKKNGLDS
ncbi:hypothetical protein BDW02DRAFT_566111 [Decorospora gaudefroyi]|uniref:Uncharacterized protein n=1 Tax=Decorospora gaudefroyi TaxID=184978 RepID=A0A6A5KNH7_9PLEO|nr:hypothetical protein BDW02DRAFT_566111 [Decorospora gaudefroyi]